ncbi:D-alanyl-lipoteichoic acid biosynthesis protein DltB [uncultured Parvimonas sp.]|jgi:D-alanyl-lipoteichoic acid biosynthesis protein dltB|uniref:D-alanyl-lipoteichoic acid biosynthesis protein DltB n=1 Tax=uncultured Parvimonas sp. TaxID=747372 RepID=UPI0028D7D741|nr:D-alanyl-lipoteichoic acid biosynthesis protein DltB [uncultured Parvimonas sp.]
MEFFSGLNFWSLLIVLSIPAIFLGIKERKNKYYILFSSLVFCFLVYSKNINSLIYLVIFLIYEYMLIKVYLRLKIEKNCDRVSILVILSLVPLFISRILPILEIDYKFGFLGISYITFKVMQMLIEIKDNMIKEVNFIDYLSFMIFFPTLSSGPIDRSRRFIKDIEKTISKTEYLDNLGKGIEYILQGLVYKIILSQLIFDKINIISEATYTTENLTIYMYLYGFYLFFDFAGYSLMAVGVSKIFGIDTPMNFNKPFLAKDMKDFWNRWHMSLSHWFRDFVFSRLVFAMFKKKIFKSSLTTAMVAYIVNMTLMGVWHGINFSYLLYGLYHGIILAITEYFQKTKFYKNNKNKKWFEYSSIFITFNLVMFGFFIFSEKFVYILQVIGGRLW